MYEIYIEIGKSIMIIAIVVFVSCLVYVIHPHEIVEKMVRFYYGIKRIYNKRI